MRHGNLSEALLALGALLLGMPAVLADSGESTFSGNASWYGVPFHGKKTASGEIFDMNKLSGAHKSLPFNTKVMVENPKTGLSKVIRVTDRGPFVRTRVMDLSREGAKELGYLSHGTAYLDFTVIPKSSRSSSSSSTTVTTTTKSTSTDSKDKSDSTGK